MLAGRNHAVCVSGGVIGQCEARGSKYTCHSVWDGGGH